MVISRWVETIAPLEKAKVKEVLNMYNNLWDQSPIVQKMKAMSEAKGEVKALQSGIVNIVNARFPHLADLARQRVVQIEDIDKLNGLLVQASNTTDEEGMRLLLAPTVA